MRSLRARAVRPPARPRRPVRPELKHAEFSDEQARRQLTEAGLPDVARLLATAPPALGGQWEALCKPGLGGRERWRWHPDAARPASYYVKRYLAPPWREQWDRLWRQCAAHSRAWWEFRQSVELNRRHIPAVRAVAVAEQMHGPLERRSTVIFEPVTGDAFDRVWPRLSVAGAPLTRPPQRQALIRALARLITAFHTAGWCHRDLYLCHVFLDADVSGVAPPRFTLIDLARVHKPRWWRLRWLIKDLGQLDSSARPLGFTRADRLRFLATYLALPPSAPRVRFYARCIVRRSDWILRRVARKAARA